MKPEEYIKKIEDGHLDKNLQKLYSIEEIDKQKKRYINAISIFKENFKEENINDIEIFSSPGRIELCGNHTDHQHGCVLAAAVNVDTIAVVSFNDSSKINLVSKGFDIKEISYDNLEFKEEEKETSTAIIKGVCDCFLKKGLRPKGFVAYVESDVLTGGGLSSSASFEILIATILKKATSCDISNVEIAKIGQFAENRYFLKNCGLMDQLVCCVGGCVFIDFSDIENPNIEKIDFSFKKAGFEIVVTDTKKSHENLSDEYSAIPSEMKTVARYFKKEFLVDVSYEDFLNNLSNLKDCCSNRAILRAAHFFDETKRAKEGFSALKNNNFDIFLKNVKSSCDSSKTLLQNIFSVNNPKDQRISVSLYIGERILKEKGAIRVHGGGFGGTTIAFVPKDLVLEYKKNMEAFFGQGSCLFLNVRSLGGSLISF